MSQRFAIARSHSAAIARVAVLAALALSACKGLEPIENVINKYGSVDVVAKATSATTARATATAIFFESASAAVPNSADQQNDQCAFQPFDSIPNVIVGQKRAGESVSLAVGSSTTTLPYEEASSRYRTPSTQPFTYQSGDVVTATIPGAADVFPASTISVKLAEPVVPGAILVPAGGQPFAILWTGTNDPTAAMLISLRYALGSSSTSTMEQIYCSAKDDGRYDIPANALTAFFAAPATSRSLSLTRYRTNQAKLASDVLIHIATRADTVRAVR
jgi:hypothetical protein